MKKSSHLITTHYIREQFGLFQNTLAEYLSISVSQLAMQEIGQRELPMGAMAKLAEILLFLHDNQNEATQEPETLKKQQAKVEHVLKVNFKDFEYRQLKEKRKLEALQKKFEQSLKLKAFAKQLSNEKSNLKEVLNQQDNSGIEKYGLVVQTKLLVKLEDLISQLACVEIVKEKGIVQFLKENNKAEKTYV